MSTHTEYVEGEQRLADVIHAFESAGESVLRIVTLANGEDDGRWLIVLERAKENQK